jgi:hypothetical protein
VKTIDSAIQTVLESSYVPLVIFIEIDFVSGIQRYTTCGHDLTWNAHTWKGLGGIVSMDSIRESSSLEAIGFKLSLSGVPNAMISLALQEKTQGRACRVYIGCFDSDNGVLIGTPFADYSGRLDTLEINRGNVESVISVNVESRMADFARPANGRFTDAYHQSKYPGDGFFKHVAKFAEADLIFFSKEQQQV